MKNKFLVYKLGTENKNRSVPICDNSSIKTDYFFVARNLMLRYGPSHGVAEFSERLGGFYPLTNFEIERQL